MFRRAAFNWATYTKKLVESSNALGKNTKVAYTALADIEYARELLNSLFLPEGLDGPTVEMIRDSVSGVATRIVTDMPDSAGLAPKKERQLHLVRSDERVAGSKTHPVADLSAPVHSKNGKMLWADIDCVSCDAKATRRCRKLDGGYSEKPHPQRKTQAETMAAKP